MKQALTPEQQTFYDEIDAKVDAYLEDEDVAAARDFLQKIVNDLPDPKSESYTEADKLFRAAIATLQAETYLELTHYDDAYEYAKDAVDAGWSTSLSHTTLAWAYYQGLDDCEEAKKHFTKALELDPHNAFAYFGRANVVRYTDGLPDALADVKAAIEADSSYIPAYTFAAELCFEMEDATTADTFLANGRQQSPNDPELALLQAQSLAAVKKYAEALIALQCVLAEDDRSLEAVLLEIELRLRRDEYSEARKLSIQASNLFPNEPFAFVQLAISQLLSGKTAFALKAAERALELNPQLVDAYSIRAAARLASDDFTGGMEDLQEITYEPLVLPELIFGYTYFNIDTDLKFPSYQKQLKELEQKAIKSMQPTEKQGEKESVNPFASMPNIPGFDVATILNQMFDSEGNVRPMFKPVLKMAMRNLPSMLKTLPPEMLASQRIDPKILDMPMGDLSDEEFDAQMKLFYQSLKHLR